MDNTSCTRNNTSVRKSQNLFGPLKEDEFIAGNLSLPEDNIKHDLAQSVVSCEGLNPLSSSEIYMQKKKRKTPNDSEDDGTGGTKRMRGLQDLGLRVESRRKPDIRIKGERSRELVTPDNTSLCESIICNSLSSNSPVNSSKGGSCSSLKRRSGQVAHVYESIKKKNRHRPLAKVLETTAKVAIPPFCNRVVGTGQSSLQEVTENKDSALESTESKKESFSVVINNNSECTGTSCEKGNSLNVSEHTGDAAANATRSCCLSKKDYAVSGVLDHPDNGFSNNFVDTPFFSEENQTEVFVASGSRKLRSFERQSSHCCQTRSVSLNDDEVDETGSMCFPVQVSYADYRLDKDNSKWQLKGKRNSRCLSKTASKGLGSSNFVDDADPSGHCLMGKWDKDASFAGDGLKVEKNSGESPISDNSEQLMECRDFSCDLGDSSLHWSSQISDAEAHIAGLSDSGFSKAGRWDLGITEASVESVYGKSGLRNSSYKNFVMGKTNTRSRNAKSSFLRGPMDCRVPLQMFVSHYHSRRLTYSRDKIMDSTNRNIYGGSSLFDVNLDVQASYQGQHVPLVSLMSKLNGKAIIGHPVTVEVLKDGYYKPLVRSIKHSPTSRRELLMNLANDSLLPVHNINSNGTIQGEAGHAVQSLSKARRKNSHHFADHRTLSRKKLAKMRKCGFLSKKTRRLSSFAVDRNYKKEGNKSVVEKLPRPVISCVPLKLVFSRLNEALNCTLSPEHHMLTSGNS